MTNIKYIVFGVIGLLLGIFIGMLIQDKSENYKKEIIKPPKEGQLKIIGVYTKTNGEKQIEIIIRQILKRIVYDTITNQDKISMDTIYGYPVDMKIKDSTGKDSTYRIFKIINKDSVNTHVENISIDSLLKK